MFENSSLVSSVSRVKNALIYSLEKEYNINDKEVAIDILKLQGMYKDNFDFINNIENVISKGIADASIDTNANKNETSISGITVEATNPVNKVIGHRYLYRKMNELYGKSEAKRLSGKMYDYSIAISDSTKILLPYCYAVDATKLVLEGRPSNQLPSVPPKRLSSYIAALCETIHQLSNHLAGAIAVGSFFLDTTHVLIYKEGYSLNDIKHNKMTRKYIENCYQSFIHSINHLSRNAIESPFTNISVFDRVKLNTLVEDMMWYFPDHKKEYIIDYIMETQRLFMEFFEQGDKVNGGRPFRFPVCFPGEESVIINNELTTFADAFSDYADGWTHHIEDLYTKYHYKDVAVKSVYVGHATELLELVSYAGKLLRVTRDHKFLTTNNTQVCAKDLKPGDHIQMSNYALDVNKHTLRVSDYIRDLYALGYKIKINTLTKDILCQTGVRPLKNSTYSGNTTRSMPLALVERAGDNNIVKRPSITKVKTKDSKQKGAIINEIPMDFNFGYFLGLYYAEGHNCAGRGKCNNSGELGISINKKETHIKNFVIDYLHSLGLKHTYDTKTDNLGVQILFYSKTLGDLLDILIGKGAENKRIHLDLINNTPEPFRWGILCGVYDGDGCVNRYSTLTTTSRFGAESLQYLAQSLHISSKIHRRKHIRGFSGENSLIQYIMHLNKKQLFDFKKRHPLSGTFKFNNTTFEKDIPKIARTTFEIRQIRHIQLKEPVKVYNIEVDNKEHLYSLPSGVITSNCTINVSKDASNELLDKDFLKDICKHEIYRYNILVSEGSKVASCCRLLSDSEMLSMGGQVNSFGSSGISLGSHRVCTINFNRLALQATSYEDYKVRLKNVTEDCAKILKAHKELLKDTVKMNIQPFIKNHWLRLERMFSTIGVLGIYEANKTLKHKFKISSDIIGDSLVILNDQVKEVSKKYSIIGNIEQIPGESMAVRLCAADKLIYGSKLVPYELYANQFVPLWEDVSIWNRMEIDGKYNKLFTGGSICHFNLGEHITPKQVERIITHACNVGCEHFALNSIYSQCENKHTTFGNHKMCPTCKGKIVERFTRVIGFMTPISSWNKTRREWEFPKRKFGAIE